MSPERAAEQPSSALSGLGITVYADPGLTPWAIVWTPLRGSF